MSNLISCLNSNNESLHFFKSSNVKIFPSSFRGTYNIKVSDVQTNEYSFDPESKLTSEYNFTHIPGSTVNGLDSYIISFSDGILSCVIGGYYFEIYNVLEKDIKDKYLHIKTRNIDLTDSNNEIDSRSTEVLSGWTETNSTILDIDVNEGLENAPIAYAFTGIRVSSDENINGSAASLKVLLEDGTLNNSALLLDLEHGSGIKSLQMRQHEASLDFTGKNPNSEITGTIKVGATGENSVAIGYSIVARGKNSLAQGDRTIANGENSHSEGFHSVAKGEGSHAEGNTTVAKGNYSHSEGTNSQANGDYSHAAGSNTIAGSANQFVIGKFNANKPDSIFEIGCGDEDNRKNVLEVTSNKTTLNGELSLTNLTNIIEASNQKIKLTSNEFKTIIGTTQKLEITDTTTTLNNDIINLNNITIDDNGIKVNTDKLILDPDGNLTVTGKLNSSTITDINNEINLKKTTTIEGTLTTTKKLTVNSEGAQIAGGVNITSGTLASAGKLTVSGGGADITGDFILKKDETQTILSIKGSPGTNEQNITLTGSTKINGNSVIDGTVDITGNTSVAELSATKLKLKYAATSTTEVSLTPAAEDSNDIILDIKDTSVTSGTKKAEKPFIITRTNKDPNDKTKDISINALEISPAGHTTVQNLTASQVTVEDKEGHSSKLTTNSLTVGKSLYVAANSNDADYFVSVDLATKTVSINNSLKVDLSNKSITLAECALTNITDITASGNLDVKNIIASGEIQADSFNATSDKRLKENIKPFESKQSILDLPVYTYDFIEGPKDQVGCLAQDLQEICPELVTENKDGYLSIKESKIVYLLLEEIKSLKARIEKLEK